MTIAKTLLDVSRNRLRRFCDRIRPAYVTVIEDEYAFRIDGDRNVYKVLTTRHSLNPPGENVAESEKESTCEELIWIPTTLDCRRDARHLSVILFDSFLARVKKRRLSGKW